MPQVDLEIDAGLVRALLRTLPEHLAHLASAPVEPVGTGWDNSVWRLRPQESAEYAVRIPVRAVAAPIIEATTAWVAEASEPLVESGIRVPVPVHHGPPAAGLPWAWSLVTWVPGTLLSQHPVSLRTPAAAALAEALPRFHRAAPAAAPVSPSRGLPLPERRRFLARHEPGAREYLGDRVVDALLDVVAEAEEAASWPNPPAWCHGDLHDHNLILDGATTVDVARSATVGILDFDDLTRGDPAVDLRVLWIAFDEATRAEARARLAASDAYDPAIWTRARGWAAASFVLPVAADPESREHFADAIAHTCRELGCG